MKKNNNTINMQKLLRNLIERLSYCPNEIMRKALRDTFYNNKIFTTAAIERLPDEKAMELGANLVIEYNNHADHDDEATKIFWDTCLAPIDTEYLKSGSK